MAVIEVAMTKARLLFAVLAVTVATTPLIARGNAVTIRLDITGGRLTQPLSITERALLDRSGVYQGGFLGDLEINGVDPQWSRYAVTFIVAPQIPTAACPAETRKAYVAIYARNPQTDEGFVYLPGRGEDGYRTNIGMMIRDGHDGRWHRASPEWASLLNSYLPRD